MTFFFKSRSQKNHGSFSWIFSSAVLSVEGENSYSLHLLKYSIDIRTCSFFEQLLNARRKELLSQALAAVTLIFETSSRPRTANGQLGRQPGLE